MHPFFGKTSPEKGGNHERRTAPGLPEGQLRRAEKAPDPGQLQRKLGLSKDQLTNLVHRMRRKALPIAGGPLGYYYAQNAGELLSTIRWLEKMVRTLLESIDGLAKAMEAFGPIEDSSGAPAETQRGGGDGP